MKVEFINPFLEAAMHVIGTMAFKVEPGKPALKQGNKTWGVVTGVIGMVGEEVTGNLVLSFDPPSILGIVSKLLGEEIPAINEEVVDAVGELTNMVSGRAKVLFEERGFRFDMATPLMLLGKDIEMTELGKRPVIVIPFTTPNGGQFMLEASLQERTKKPMQR